MNTGFRTASVVGTRRGGATHGRALRLLLSLVVLGSAGCGDMAPPAARAGGLPQPALPAPGPMRHTVPQGSSQAAVPPPAAAGLAAGADETVGDHSTVGSVGTTRIVFLHGLHSPFGMALAMSRMPTP